MSDTLTLALDGQVSLEAFSEAIAGLEDLVAALAREAGQQSREPVQWMIESLYTSSAVATIRGIGPAERVDRVVREYEAVGEAVRDGSLDRLPAPVRRASRPFLELLQGDAVPSIRFETENREVIVPSRRHLRLVCEEPFVTEPAVGAVVGRVETLSHRRGLRFTLFDEVHDKAVSCYLRQNHEEIMRDIWGHRAEVIGLVSRDPESGRPLAVRNVTQVERLTEELLDWRRAKGVAPAMSATAPETVIRLVRDAW